MVQTEGALDAAFCGKCGEGARETGACPFQSEINDDHDDCDMDCCDECRGNCADDI